MQKHAAVIHIHLTTDPATLTVDGSRYVPASTHVTDALARATACLARDPAVITVITCRVVLGDRRSPPRAPKNQPFVDLILPGCAGVTPSRSCEAVPILPESKQAIEEAAILVFRECFGLPRQDTDREQSLEVPAEPIPAH